MIDFTDTFRPRRVLKWIKKFSTRRLRELTYLWGSVFGHGDFERFAIVGYARTGSNFLSSGLESSASTRLHKEIFGAHSREIGKDYEKILGRMYQKQPRSVKVVGFKLFYYHLTNDEWEKFLHHDDIKIIHITRKNVLKTILSLDIALKTDQWNTSFIRLKSVEKKTRLETQNLLDRIEEIRAYEEITRSRFKDRDILEITYEDLVRDPMSEFKRVEEYLGINDIDPNRITLRKQNPEKLSVLIENYDEVSQILAGTNYAQFLTD